MLGVGVGWDKARVLLLSTPIIQETFGSVWRQSWLADLGECCWNLVSRSQRYCSVSYHTQDSLSTPPRKNCQPPKVNDAKAEKPCCMAPLSQQFTKTSDTVSWLTFPPRLSTPRRQVIHVSCWVFEYSWHLRTEGRWEGTSRFKLRALGDHAAHHQSVDKHFIHSTFNKYSLSTYLTPSSSVWGTGNTSMSKTEFLLNEMYYYKGRQTIKQRNKMISDRDKYHEDNKSVMK